MEIMKLYPSAVSRERAKVAVSICVGRKRKAHGDAVKNTAAFNEG